MVINIGDYALQTLLLLDNRIVKCQIKYRAEIYYLMGHIFLLLLCHYLSIFNEIGLIEYKNLQ